MPAQYMFMEKKVAFIDVVKKQPKIMLKNTQIATTLIIQFFNMVPCMVQDLIYLMGYLE